MGAADDDATALVVVVPEAESLVGPLRTALDASAAEGMPAHVTVLFPFAPVAALDDADADRLARTLRSTRAFTVRFARTARFADDVLWLAPEPAAPFAALTRAVEAAFPRWPAYGGAFDEPVPHLTVADARGADEGALDAAEASLPAEFEVRTRVDRVVWMARTGGRWRPVREFPLGS